MRRSAVVAATTALGALLAARSAAALTVTLAPVAPIVVGKPATFRVANVADADGPVTYEWSFGDDSTGAAAPVTDNQPSHTYTTVGHYTLLVRASDNSARTSATSVVTVYAPATDKPPSNSSSIILDSTRRQIWTVNPDSDSVTTIDTTQVKKVREVKVGKDPHFLAQAPDGTIWVANQMSDEIVVLDRDSGEIKARIALPYASQPRSVVFGPTSGMAYVSLFATGKLLEIDPGTRAIKRDVALGPTPAGVSVAADGRVFVTRFISPKDHGEVWVVSPQTFTVTNTISLAFDKGPDTQSSGRGVPNYVSAAIISPDGTQAWVTAKKDNTARGLQRDGQALTSDNFVRPAVCIIDLKTEKEVFANRQDVDNRSTPVAVSFSPLGDYAFVLIQPSNWIGIMDGYTGLGISGIRDVGNAPDGLVMTSDGKLFVNAFLSREVIVYDVASSLSSEDHAAPTPMARIRTIDVEPLSEQLLLGKKIFFNAADTRMGHAGYISCVSCHFGGFSDGRVWDFTDRGEGLRNTKSMLGVRGMGEGRVHWSANFNEIQDFERDIRHDFEGSGFMSDAEFNARKDSSGHYDPFAKDAAGVSKELDALAAYITSLGKVPRSPFRNADGSFTTAALEGKKIFASAGCPQCHSGPDFTDSATNMLHDVGTLLPSSGGRLFGKLEGIDTPSLKGLWQSAPFYHDGRAENLHDLFAIYNRDDRMGKTSDLTPTQLDQLVEYLNELDDEPEPAITTPPPPTPTAHGACSVEPSTISAGARRTGLGIALVVGAVAVGVTVGRRRRRRNDRL